MGSEGRKGTRRITDQLCQVLRLSDATKSRTSAFVRTLLRLSPGHDFKKAIKPNSFNCNKDGRQSVIRVNCLSSPKRVIVKLSLIYIIAG